MVYIVIYDDISWSIIIYQGRALKKLTDRLQIGQNLLNVPNTGQDKPASILP